MARSPKVIVDRPTTRRIGALRALWPFVRPYRGLLAAALAALMLTAGISLVLPVAVRRIVDGFSHGAQLLDEYFVAALGIAALGTAWEARAQVPDDKGRGNETLRAGVRGSARYAAYD